MKCAFCGKGMEEVPRFISGLNDVLICQECVGQALIVLCAQGWIPPTVTISVKVDVPKAEAAG